MNVSGSSPPVNAITLGFIPIFSNCSPALIVACSPAPSPSKHNIIFSDSLFINPSCSLVSAVPINATTLSYPIVLALITSINPSIIITNPFLRDASFAI